MRVDGMIDLISRVESPYITVHQDRCVLVRNRNADCLRCASVCTSGCIYYDEQAQQLVVSPEKCIGCGTCATNCPTCCLEAHHPNDAALFNECQASAVANEGALVVVCAQLLERAKGLYDSSKVVRVECLGRIEESMLTTMVSYGVTEIVLVHGECDKCPYNTGIAMAQRVVDTECVLLQAWKSPVQVRIAAKLPRSVHKQGQDSFDRDKREALLAGTREGARMGAAVANLAVQEALGQTPESGPTTHSPYVKTMNDGTLPHFVPDRRERLLDALASLGEPDDVMIDTRLWGHVIIDTDRCESCQMCAVFCPTGALRKFGDPEQADEPFGVDHYPGDCVKCRCCTTICPADALELSEKVFAVDMLAGKTYSYTMRPPKVKKSGPHTIWHTMQQYMNIPEVYER